MFTVEPYDLCAAHARRHSGADEIITDRGESILQVVARHTGHRCQAAWDPDAPNGWPYPAFDLQNSIAYIALLTSRGCPMDCPYCASRYLEPVVRRRSPAAVIDEISHWHQHHGVVDFAFYDDALMVDATRHAIPIMEGIIAKQMNLYLHTPNAIHIRALTAQIASLMKQAGFHTLRLGLETIAFEGRQGLDAKVTREEFLRAVQHLLSAGFKPPQIGAYLLVGLPNQRLAGVEAAIRIVRDAGIQPVLAHYTPIPHTPLWAAACKASRYDLASDPIYTNNAIFPCSPDDFSWDQLSRLKQLAGG